MDTIRAIDRLVVGRKSIGGYFWPRDVLNP
jgi:hypothetical protein